MSQEHWNAIDGFITTTLVREDDALTGAVRRSQEAGLPEIQVSAPQARQLHLLARAIGAERILEIGTLGGHSAIAMARALSADGRLVTIEIDDAHADVAEDNFKRAGVDDRIVLHRGPALDVLPTVADALDRPFDLVFIDADKENNANYVEWAVKMTRVGSIVIVDNVVRAGRVIDPAVDDDSTVGTRRLYDMLTDHPSLDATVIQTVGSKGHDGYVLAIRT